MSKKNTVRSARALSAARRASLASVSTAAFAVGVSSRNAAEAVRAACGPKPVMTLYKAARDAFIAGRMAAALPSNATESERIASATVLITKYQGHGGKAKLRTGMMGRRTKEQELAYAAARVAWTGICKLAGVKTPDARGGDTSGTRQRAPNRKGAKTKGKAGNVVALSPKVKNADDAVRYVRVQAKALAAFCNKNAGLIPTPVGQAITAFHQAIFKNIND
jgi:hypothetical protein